MSTGWTISTLGAAAGIASVAAACRLQQLRFAIKRRNESLDPTKDYELIVRNLLFLEDSFLFRISLEFALFKTYAIPSISKLLHSTRETAARGLKRYDDTDLILRSIMESGIESKRGQLAMGRMNCIHGKYAITNDDFLYVMSAFVTEPLVFFDRFGWRRFTDVEKEALFNLWTKIGTQMGIKNIPSSLLELLAWSEAYEAREMKFAGTNLAVAAPTMNLLLSIVPPCLRSIGRQAVIGLVDDRLACSLGFKRDFMARFLGSAVTGLLLVRAACLRWLVPPRRSGVRRTFEEATDPVQAFNADGEELLKTQFNVYGNSYPDGYRISELGPACAAPGCLGRIH